jgi:hypothetical protein
MTSKKTKKSQRYQKNEKNQSKKNQSKKHKKVISYTKNKKGGANMNDVDIDEIGDVYDALDIKEKFGGIFDSMKINDGSLNDKRSEMPQMDCVIL